MRKIIILLFFCFSMFPVYAVNYFISSSSGKDSNSGLDQENPWKTLAKFQKESVKFKPGDIIYFKSGDVWNESLILSNINGEFNNPITIKSYGSGARPKISVVKEQKLNFSLVDNNIWRANYFTNPNRIIFDGREELGTILLSELGKLVPDLVTFYYDEPNQDLYVYSKSDPNTRSIQLSFERRSLFVSICQNLNIENIEFEGGYFHGIGLYGSKNIKLSNIKAGVMSEEAVVIDKSYNGDVSSENIIISNSIFDTEFTLDYSRAEYFSGASWRGGTDGIKYNSCNGGEIKNSKFINWSHASIELSTDLSDEITGVKIFNNSFSIPNLPYGGAVTTDGGAHDNEIFNNHFYKTKDSQINGYNNHIHHNIFEEIQNSTIHPNSTIGYGISLMNYYQGSHDNIVENNLFIKCDGAGIIVVGDASGGVTKDNIIRNNLIYECGVNENNRGLILYSQNGSMNSKNGNIFQNNLVYNSKEDNTVQYYDTYITPLELNNLNKDSYGNTMSNNIMDNPLFKNEENDWHLKFGSPAINKGIKPLSTEDYDGNPIQNNGTLPDIGIYEFIENTTGEIKADAGSDQSICFGESVILTASGGSIYKWSTGAITPSIEVDPKETTVYSVEVSKDGISDIDQVQVEVNKVIADAGPDKTIIEGESVTLTALGGESYVWSTGETTSSITVSPSESSTYSVTVIHGECDDTDTVKVIVNSTVSRIVADAGSDQSICFGESVILTASGGSTYKWSTGAITPSIEVDPKETTVYSVEVSKDGISDIDQVQVEVNKVIADAGPDKTIIEGENVTLTALGGESYIWSTGETTSSITVSPSSTTNYKVRAIDGECESSDNVMVIVTPIDVLENANAGEDSTICKGESLILTATGGANYRWGSGETVSSIEVSPISTTTYSVEISKGGETIIDRVVVNVENCQEEEGVKIESDELYAYPNPTDGKLMIRFNSLDETVNLNVVNVNGSFVKSESVKSINNLVNREIDLSGLSVGVYFVRINSSTVSSTKKIMVY